MKLLFLLAALCCVAASAELIAMNMYFGTACGDSNLFAVAQTPIQLGCKNGVKYHVSGDDLKVSTYSTTDCTGTAGGTSTAFELNKCTEQGSSDMSATIVVMSDTKFKAYLEGPGNLVTKNYQTSDTCDGTLTETVIVSTANGKCVKQSATTSAKISWDGKERVRKLYSSTDCSGTVTSTESDKNKICTNTTSTNKQSEYITFNPSAGLRSTNFQSTMIFGIIFIASCLH